jgi:hypothetical protein
MNKTNPELPDSLAAKFISALKAPFVAALQTQFVSALIALIALIDPFVTSVVNLCKAMIEKIPGLARGLPMLLMAGALFYFVMQLNPANFGYWFDRILFPYARPHDEPVGVARGAAMKRRALIVSAAVVSAGFAP